MTVFAPDQPVTLQPQQGVQVTAAVADFLLFASYSTISSFLIFITIRHREFVRDIRGILMLFLHFILACGFSHLGMMIHIVFGNSSAGWFAMWMKLAAAAVSAFAALVLPKVTAQASSKIYKQIESQLTRQQKLEQEKKQVTEARKIVDDVQLQRRVFDILRSTAPAMTRHKDNVIAAALAVPVYVAKDTELATVHEEVAAPDVTDDDVAYSCICESERIAAQSHVSLTLQNSPTGGSTPASNSLWDQVHISTSDRSQALEEVRSVLRTGRAKQINSATAALLMGNRAPASLLQELTHHYSNSDVLLESSMDQQSQDGSAERLYQEAGFVSVSNRSMAGNFPLDSERTPSPSLNNPHYVPVTPEIGETSAAEYPVSGCWYACRVMLPSNISKRAEGELDLKIDSTGKILRLDQATIDLVVCNSVKANLHDKGTQGNAKRQAWSNQAAGDVVHTTKPEDGYDELAKPEAESSTYLYSILLVKAMPEDEFTSTDLDMLRDVCDHFSVTIEQADMLESERKHMRKLAEMEKQKRKATDTFLSMISHELRTPMHAILGYADLLLDTSLDEEQQDYVYTIASSGSSLCELLNDVLDLTKYELGQASLEHQPFSIRGCIEDTLHLLTHNANEKQVHLSYFFRSATFDKNGHLIQDGLSARPLSTATIAGSVLSYISGNGYALRSDSCPEIVVGDATRFRQVLINLIGNAVKFTPSGEVVISVTTLRASGSELDEDSEDVHESSRRSGVQTIEKFFRDPQAPMKLLRCHANQLPYFWNERQDSFQLVYGPGYDVYSDSPRGNVADSKLVSADDDTGSGLDRGDTDSGEEQSAGQSTMLRKKHDTRRKRAKSKSATNYDSTPIRIASRNDRTNHESEDSKERVLVIVEVADTGIGVPESAGARMFSKFKQADNSIARRFGGTGLGLPIVKRLVDLQDGAIAVTSKEGQGTSFFLAFSLPLHVTKRSMISNTGTRKTSKSKSRVQRPKPYVPVASPKQLIPSGISTSFRGFGDETITFKLKQPAVEAVQAVSRSRSMIALVVDDNPVDYFAATQRLQEVGIAVANSEHQFFSANGTFISGQHGTGTLSHRRGSAEPSSTSFDLSMLTSSFQNSNPDRSDTQRTNPQGYLLPNLKSSTDASRSHASSHAWSAVVFKLLEDICQNVDSSMISNTPKFSLKTLVQLLGNGEDDPSNQSQNTQNNISNRLLVVDLETALAHNSIDDLNQLLAAGIPTIVLAPSAVAVRAAGVAIRGSARASVQSHKNGSVRDDLTHVNALEHAWNGAEPLYPLPPGSPPRSLGYSSSADSSNSSRQRSARSRPHEGLSSSVFSLGTDCGVSDDEGISDALANAVGLWNTHGSTTVGNMHPQNPSHPLAQSSSVPSVRAPHTDTTGPSDGTARDVQGDCESLSPHANHAGNSQHVRRTRSRSTDDERRSAEQRSAKSSQEESLDGFLVPSAGSLLTSVRTSKQGFWRVLPKPLRLSGLCTALARLLDFDVQELSMSNGAFAPVAQYFADAAKVRSRFGAAPGMSRSPSRGSGSSEGMTTPRIDKSARDGEAHSMSNMNVSKTQDTQPPLNGPPAKVDSQHHQLPGRLSSIGDQSSITSADNRSRQMRPANWFSLNANSDQGVGTRNTTATMTALHGVSSSSASTSANSARQSCDNTSPPLSPSIIGLSTENLTSGHPPLPARSDRRESHSDNTMPTNTTHSQTIFLHPLGAFTATGVFFSNAVLQRGQPRPFTELRALVVDDSPTNLRYACRLLTKLGVAHETATNGFDAIDLAKNAEPKFDICFMDLNMPGMDGLAATQRIMRRDDFPVHKRPWVAALTASVMQQDRMMCANAGMTYFIPKPFRLQDVQRALVFYQRTEANIQRYVFTHSAQRFGGPSMIPEAQSHAESITTPTSLSVAAAALASQASELSDDFDGRSSAVPDALLHD